MTVYPLTPKSQIKCRQDFILLSYYGNEEWHAIQHHACATHSASCLYSGWLHTFERAVLRPESVPLAQGTPIKKEREVRP